MLPEPPYTYDPSTHVLGSQLRTELLAEVPTESWSTYGDPTPETHVKGIAGGRGFAPCSVWQLIWICQSTAAKIKRGPHMNCVRHSRLHRAAMYWFTNAGGGGTLALGMISGLDLFGHTSRHRVVIARMEEGTWLLADAAFANNPNLSRWIAGVHGRALSDLEMS